MKKLVAMSMITALSIINLDDAAAKESLLLAGFQAGNANEQYYFIGGITPLREQDKLGNGWVQTWWIDNAVYQFTSGSTLVRAEAPGLRYSVGRQFSRKGGGGGWQLGISVRDTRLDQNLPAVTTKGLNTGLYAVVEGQRDLGQRWKLDVIGSGVASSYVSYWARIKLVRKVLSGRHTHGVEYVASGDPDYQLSSIAYTTGNWKMGSASVTGRLGVSRTLGAAQFVYIGLEWIRYRP